MSESDQKIIILWKQHKSVKMVTQCCGYSRYKVIKCLSTYGYALNTTHQKILQLYKQGETAEQIAKALGLNAKVVKAYFPRVRPEYGKHYSKNAKKLYEWRKRKEKENEG